MKQKFPNLRRGLTALVLSLLLCAQALAAMPEYLVPGGSTAGIKLYTGGLLITALDEDAPAQRAGLRAGDTILKIDGACVSSAADAVRQLSGGKSVRLLVQRGQKQAEFFLTPEKTQQGYRLGVSVRDNISGIGTITFYDPETGVCGALGHGVTGLSGMQPLAATGGILVPSVVSGVKKGVRGTPGELHGSFDVSTALGSVSQNETHGIFGTLNASPAHEAVPVADSGSVGGHVICELAKAGYEDLTIVDYEKLTEENIFRHVLGMEYVNRYKCEALNTYIQKNIPEVKITTLAERIEDAIIEEDIVFEDYNLIISATGNHNLNRWVNSWILDNKIEVPVVYLWNEVYGIGNHVAYIKYGNCGCYECFFDRDEETGELYDKTSYCKRGQIITESAGGCGKTYVPYGNLVSLKTMLLCLKMVKDIFEEKLDDNLLISLKGDNDYLEKHNLEISGRYLRQQERIKILTGKQFVNINCGVCNDCNGK